jgi:hypothetical protein
LVRRHHDRAATEAPDSRRALRVRRDHLAPVIHRDRPGPRGPGAVLPRG